LRYGGGGRRRKEGVKRRNGSFCRAFWLFSRRQPFQPSFPHVTPRSETAGTHRPPETPFPPQRCSGQGQRPVNKPAQGNALGIKRRGNDPSPERATPPLPPFQGLALCVDANPRRCLGLACLRTFGAPAIRNRADQTGLPAQQPRPARTRRLAGHWRYSSAHEWLPGALTVMRCDDWSGQEPQG
jgi:hypothetical protein